MAKPSCDLVLPSFRVCPFDTRVGRPGKRFFIFGLADVKIRLLQLLKWPMMRGQCFKTLMPK